MLAHRHQPAHGGEAVKVLRVVSFAAPVRKFPDEAAASKSLRELDVGPVKLSQKDLGKAPAPFWVAELVQGSSRKFEEKGGVVVHVGRGWMARLAWTKEPCMRCEIS